MEAFFRDNWVSLLSLLIALLGGVPGIFAVVNYIRARAQLTVVPSTVMFGNSKFEPDPIVYTHVLFTLTLTNAGDKPLTPATFNLRLFANGRWVKFNPRLIPEGVDFQSDLQEIDLNEPWKRDLQRYSGSIAYGVPLNGHLYFLTDEVSLAEITNLKDRKFELTCHDVFGKKHKEVIRHSSDMIDKPTEYPKHGSTIKPRSNVEQ